MFEKGVATKLSAKVGLSNQRVRFALANAVFGDVVLHVTLVVIDVGAIIELPAA